MRMNTRHRIIAQMALAGCLWLGACSQDNSNTPGTPAEPARVESLTIEGLNDQTWVYVSLEQGKVVGSSPLGDEEQDDPHQQRNLRYGQRRYSVGDQQELQRPGRGPDRRIYGRHGRPHHTALTFPHLTHPKKGRLPVGRRPFSHAVPPAGKGRSDTGRRLFP